MACSFAAEDFHLLPKHQLAWRSQFRGSKRLQVGPNQSSVPTQIIVAAEVTRAATDMHELQPMIEAMHRNLQAAHCGPPRVLLADAGYYSEANVRQAEGKGPELLLAAGLSVLERMDRKLATQRGRRLYEQRRWMIEPVFGDVKENRGIRRFMRRGIVACASEWKLIAATHNLKKLYRRARPSPRPANSNPRRGDRATAAAAA